jgi:hypothetical protein
MADDGDGMLSMELQARQIAENATKYNGSSPCPTCGVVMNPVEFLSNRGHCLSCVTQRNAKRVKGKMI